MKKLKLLTKYLRLIFLVSLLLSQTPLQVVFATNAAEEAARLRQGITYADPPTVCVSSTRQVNSTPSSSATPGQYVSIGNIPVEGIEVGVSIYGGLWQNDTWVIQNKDQIDRINNGEFTAESLGATIGDSSDDVGIGNRDNPLHNTASFAELDMGSALGGLPNGTKLEITFGSKSMIIEKADIGGGGGSVSGKTRAVDLWWEAGRYLDFKEGLSVMKVRAVEPSTPTTPVTGASSPSYNASGSCTCSSVSAPTIPGSTTQQHTVLLDPGHGSIVPDYVDTVTGLGDRETDNSPETQDMWDVAQIAKTQLEQKGYRVILSKDSATAATNKRARVNKAVENNASIAVSIHHDTAQAWEWAEVWPQFVGGYREGPNGENKLVFSNQDTADKSKQYSEAIAKARSEAEGRAATVVQDQSGSFGKDRAGLQSFGNLSLLQLWSDKVPWVYNEVGTGGEALSQENKTKYATGIVNGIAAALSSETPSPQQSANVDCAGGGGIVSGNIVQTALNLAWPYRVKDGKKYEADAKPEYVAAMKKFNGSTGTDEFSDCGVFVSTVMHASGADSEFPKRGTSIMKPYLESSPKYTIFTSITSETELQPGDILIRPGHIYIYTGQPNAKAAEASLHGRVPGIRESVILPPKDGYIVARLKLGLTLPDTKI